MLDDNLFGTKIMNCFVHKKEKATHICVDLYCYSNPIICAFCMSDNKYRLQHSSHESAVKPVFEAAEHIAAMIRSHTKSIESVYERTIGNRDNESIKSNIQRFPLLMEQLDNRIDNLRGQLELEVELLLKQFQKQILIQKQEFVKRVEDYKRVFAGNMEFIKRECCDVMNFQSSLKYYNNPNNLILKLINQTQRKSLDWFILQKQTLLKIVSILQNPQFCSTLTTNLIKLNKSSMTVMPFWKGQKKQVDNERELRSWIKGNINNWVQVPEIAELDGRALEFGGYNKNMQNYYQVSV